MLTFSVPRHLLSERWCVPAYKSHASTYFIRSHLRFRQLGEITTIRSGTYISEYVDQGIPYLRVDNIRPFQINENPEDIVFVSPQAAHTLTRSRIEEGDILLARTGTLGKAALVSPPNAGWILSQHVTRLSPSSLVLPGYLTSCLNSSLGRSQLVDGGYGSTRLELTHDVLAEVKIPWLDNTTQEKIQDLVVRGATLNNEANLILRNCIAALDEGVGVMVGTETGHTIFEVLAAAANPLWTPRYFHPAYTQAIDELEQRFECVRLGQIALISRGKGTRVSDYVRRGVPFVRTTSLINYGIDPFPDHYASEHTYQEYQQPVSEGDILYSIEGKIGSCGYLLRDQRCVFKNHIERIRVRKPWNPALVFLLLNTKVAKAQAKRNVVIQATLPGMANRLRDIKIPIRARNHSHAPRFESLVNTLTTEAERAFHKKTIAFASWTSAMGQLAESLRTP